MVDAARLTFEDGDEVVSLARGVEKQASTVSEVLVRESDELCITWSVSN